MTVPGIGLTAIETPEFNLRLTLESGQVFHWLRRGNGWVGLIDRHPVYLEQHSATLLVSEGQEQLVSRYFALDHPLEEIYATFPDDPAMNEALTFCRGLRLIRQPPWECLATFITSALKQMKHIQQMSHSIRRSFGTPISWDTEFLYAYPAPGQLAAVSETDLRTCRLGFRAKNLRGTAAMIDAGDIDLERVSTMEDGAAIAELCRLPGVGDKIANCVLLFGFERPRAFPIDVWIGRVLREIYFKGMRKVSAARLKQFSQEYFGPFGGYAQQYLFHHARRTWRRRTRE
jgi:N-glycosylase/DNA lyase